MHARPGLSHVLPYLDESPFPPLLPRCPTLASRADTASAHLLASIVVRIPALLTASPNTDRCEWTLTSISHMRSHNGPGALEEMAAPTLVTTGEKLPGNPRGKCKNGERATLSGL